MDKTERLFDAIEHPEHFSDEELDAMLKDPETGEIYKLISKTKDALTNCSKPDIDNEWERFAATHQTTKPKYLMFFGRHAAAVIIGAVVSLAAVAAGISFTVSTITHKPEVTVSETNDKTTEISNAETPTTVIDEQPEAETIIFKDETLETIMENISLYYNIETMFANDEAKSVRLYFKWNQNNQLNEVVEMLNSFDRINITLQNNTLTVE